MRLDVLSIFPEYLAPLDLSLIGKARRDGLLDLRVRDLREHTYDRHRTVDDTPYGGGAGMVMKPEPWAEALEAVLADAGARPRLLVPGPGGTPFTQSAAKRLAQEEHLVFACGRYEGIDERVYDFAREAFDGRVEIVSLGDYVLNGGEVAVLAMVEAIARLLPGVIGNAESLVEESHEDGLLEYPVYTKPALWRGRAVPEVLLGGNHGAIAAWRHEQRLARTAERRPDLLPATAVTSTAGDLVVSTATAADAGEVLTVLRACGEAAELEVAALAQEIHDRVSLVWTVRHGTGGRLLGCVRAAVRQGADGTPVWHVDRLCVAPDITDPVVPRSLWQAATTARPAGVDATRWEADQALVDAVVGKDRRARRRTGDDGLVEVTLTSRR